MLNPLQLFFHGPGYLEKKEGTQEAMINIFHPLSELSQ